MAREWFIRVGSKDKVIEEFRVPIYKLDSKNLHDFLRALIVRYRTNKPSEMLNYYVNKRRGGPDRLWMADVQRYFCHEKRWNGLWCGDWECYAFAVFELTPEQADAIKSLHEQNRRAS